MKNHSHMPEVIGCHEEEITDEDWPSIDKSIKEYQKGIYVTDEEVKKRLNL